MAAAAILKNRKMAILQRFELVTVNCKSNTLTTRLLSHKLPHTRVLLVHFKLYDYAVYCTVRICSIIFLVNSDGIFQLVWTSKQK